MQKYRVTKTVYHEYSVSAESREEAIGIVSSRGGDELVEWYDEQFTADEEDDFEDVEFEDEEDDGIDDG